MFAEKFQIYISSHFKKFHSSPLLNKSTFVKQTIAFQAKLLSQYVFQSIQYGYETFQNITPILHSIICSERNIASITNKRQLEKEKGSYKFMFSL